MCLCLFAGAAAVAFAVAVVGAAAVVAVAAVAVADVVIVVNAALCIGASLQRGKQPTTSCAAFELQFTHANGKSVLLPCVPV